jgi:hypothetical protein
VWSYIGVRVHVKTGPQTFQKSRSKLKVLGFYGFTIKKLHSVDSQILGTAVQNLVAWGHQDLFTLAHKRSAEPGFTQHAPCFGR